MGFCPGGVWVMGCNSLPTEAMDPKMYGILEVMGCGKHGLWGCQLYYRMTSVFPMETRQTTKTIAMSSDPGRNSLLAHSVCAIPHFLLPSTFLTTSSSIFPFLLPLHAPSYFILAWVFCKLCMCAWIEISSNSKLIIEWQQPACRCDFSPQNNLFTVDWHQTVLQHISILPIEMESCQGSWKICRSWKFRAQSWYRHNWYSHSLYNSLPSLKIINSFMDRLCNTLTTPQHQQKHAWQAFQDLALNAEESLQHCPMTWKPDSSTRICQKDKGKSLSIELRDLHWESFVLTTPTTCPPLAGRECSTWCFISRPFQGFVGKKFGGWQHVLCFLSWYLFYFSHHFWHLHVAVHLNRVSPMPNSNSSFSCGESHLTTDTEATSSCTALNPAWLSFHHGFSSFWTYTKCQIPCSATSLNLGTRRKALHHAGSGWHPTSHTFCYSTWNHLKC